MNEVRGLFRKIINGQSAMKQELLTRIDRIDKKLVGRIDGLEKEMKDGFKKVDSRLDKIGKSVAFLEDDTPAREEHDKLEKRVTKVEKNSKPKLRYNTFPPAFNPIISPRLLTK